MSVLLTQFLKQADSGSVLRYEAKERATLRQPEWAAGELFHSAFSCCSFLSCASGILECQAQFGLLLVFIAQQLSGSVTCSSNIPPRFRIPWNCEGVCAW